MRHIPMKSKPFPTTSVTVTMILAIVLTISSTISTSYCAFGSGGFQCNEPFARYGGMLAMVTFISLPLLVVSAAIAAWRLVAWLRAR
ncbi:hypothetical protein APR50_28405 [Variovorax paradoxus]|nr:hypothetical protein APR50_28405 [Variovorax paradoxus]KPV03137.1 hypothetical protein APR49_27425 [Variovorax paradoxus]KPV17623.1 hypothetical protein APR48_41795 [Variovorax paradoxus]KPV28347.1 hypothetical protein APR47_28995 [Variovorax paradoxus]